MSSTSSGKIALVTVALISTIVSAGVVYGFQALKTLLLKERIFINLCTAEGVVETCDAQQLQLNWMFTLATSIAAVAILPAGLILDYQGPRKTYAVGCILVLLGNALFTLQVYTLGFILIATAGPFLFISTIHLANVFQEYSGMYIAAINGALDSSTLIYFCFLKISAVSSLTTQQLITIHSVVIIILGAWLIYLMPEMSLQAQAPMSTLVEMSEYQPVEAREDSPVRHRRNSSMIGIKKVPPVQDFSKLEIPVSDQPDSPCSQKSTAVYTSPVSKLLSITQSAKFWGILITTCLFMIRINMFINSMDLHKGIDSSLVDLFNIALTLFGIITIPLIGTILDRFDACVSFCCLWSLALAVNLMQIIDGGLVGKTISICLVAIIRPFFYSTCSHYVSQAFGFQNFGSIYGVIILVCGLFNFLQYPIIEGAMQAGSFQWVDLAFLILFLAWGVFPYAMLKALI